MRSDHADGLAASRDASAMVVETRGPCLMPGASGSKRPMSPAASSRNVSALQTKRVHAGGGGGERAEASCPRAPPPNHHGTRARREGWEEDAAELLLSAAATAGVCV